jgi:formylglycine-generating enzyme required for sulfatase activity
MMTSFNQEERANASLHLYGLRNAVRVKRSSATTKYWWGDEIGRNRANCWGCGSQWDSKQTAPVGSFAANAFDLHDMHGNVFQWVQDHYHEDYQGAPTNGSYWSGGHWSHLIIRGGAWSSYPQDLRAAYRSSDLPGARHYNVGFRVARML